MKMDFIFKTISYFDDKSINKITTEEYIDLNKNDVIVLIDDIIFDRFTSHNIHLSDEKKRTYRIDNTVMTINQLKDFINTEDDKVKFLNKVGSDINKSNQQTFDFDKDNPSYRLLEYDIPNEWILHKDCDMNSTHKFIIKIYFS